MGKRFAILIGAAALGAAVIAAGASADFRSVADPRGDTKCFRPGPRGCSDRTRNADIVRATAGHGKNGWLKHTIRVVGKFKTASLYINTDSDRACEWSLPVVRGSSPGLEGCTLEGGDPARYDFHRHSVEIFFSKRSIGNPQSYGWSVDTWAGDREYGAKDFVPNRRGYIRHRFGAAAAGVVALGAAASAGVVKYDTKLTLTKEGGGRLAGLYHGKVLSDSDHNPGYDRANWVTKCMDGRRVVLFKRRPGADRRLGSDRSGGRHGAHGGWGVLVSRDLGNHVWAKVKPKVRDRYVCRADRAHFGDFDH